MRLGSFRKWYKEFRFWFAAGNKSLTAYYYKNLYRPRKRSLAAFIDCYGRLKSNVTFLQVGANDGFFHDPLYKFIRRYGWKGVLLEPQQDVFIRYLQRLYKGVDGVTPVNAALDHADGYRPVYKIAFSNSRWATGLTTFSYDTIRAAIDSGHVERSARRHGESLPSDREAYVTEQQVKCISPETLIRTYRLKPLDWVQIDAEGYDFEIIKMLDVGQLSPEVIVFEHTHLPEKEYQECRKHLVQNGYSLSRISENTIALRTWNKAWAEYFDNDNKQA